MSKTMGYLKLSYDITNKTLANASTKVTGALRIQCVENIAWGDPGNAYLVELLNHCGTHIDFPAHMLENGRKLMDYSLDELVFKPFLLDIPLGKEQVVTVSDLECHKTKIVDCSLLLIRTGFGYYRSAKLQDYILSAPSLSVEAAAYLADNFTNLRAVGVDLLSLESVADQRHGFLGHKTLLKKGILIIEDMSLLHCDDNMSKVFVIPLFIEGIDSFHATVFAEVSD